MSEFSFNRKILYPRETTYSTRKVEYYDKKKRKKIRRQQESKIIEEQTSDYYFWFEDEIAGWA